MIVNQEADRILNLYADLEAAFLDLCVLIGTDQTVNRASIDAPLHLIWQHIGFLNQQLGDFLATLPAHNESQQAQAVGPSHAAPLARLNGEPEEEHV